ncbi:MAG: hypothetical protein QXQ50_09415 [Candidatus Bathyarchaeia archaeon]
MVSVTVSAKENAVINVIEVKPELIEQLKELLKEMDVDYRDYDTVKILRIKLDKVKLYLYT